MTGTRGHPLTPRSGRRSCPLKPQPIVAITAILLVILHARAAAADPGWFGQDARLTWYGDLRLRYEADWDSHRADGQLRDDRQRGRVRARAGVDVRLSDAWSAGARVRTGSHHSQQSPHLTFIADDGIRDELDFVVDRYFARFERDGAWAWGGRDTYPFWQQHELFWDEDVTPTGLAGAHDLRLGDGTLTATVGAFYLPDGGHDLHGQAVAGQLRYRAATDIGDVTFAAGLHYLHGEEGAENLRNRNGERDYLIGVLGAQWGIRRRNIPIALGADLFYNVEDYTAADVAPFPARDADQVLGYVFSARAGQLEKRHDWLVGYYYAHIETFAVNASYAQDDWIRFGTGAQTDASDFEGHEIRLGYALSRSLNLLARLYVVEAITTRQDGNRFRLDLNWKF